jgi:putative phosphoribosyl transferase
MTTTTPIASNQRAVEILVGNHQLTGFLNIPESAKGIVLFALRSGRGRYRSGNQYVASVLQRAGIATLLLDLLDEREADIRSKVFDVTLLANRLKTSAAWVREKDQNRGLKLGYFGVSTGAAASLVAAADQGTEVKAVVSRGGRPDLADEALPHVRAATLLIVGGGDKPLIEINHRALTRLQCVKELKVIPGASHVFPEPEFEEAARLASQWFQRHLVCEDMPELAERSEPVLCSDLL